MNIQDIIAAPIEHNASGAERYSVHQIRSAFDLGVLSAHERLAPPRIDDMIAGLECAAQLAETDERRQCLGSAARYVKHMLGRS